MEMILKRSILLLISVFCLISAYSGAYATGEATSTNVLTAPVVTQEVTQKRTISQVRFSDVPVDHWASNAVYDLVNMGVTQGYPDGTYRGNNNITRYETAMFLSKLAANIGDSNDKVDIAVEKLKDDLRAEIRTLRADIAGLKNTPNDGDEKPISGSYTSRIIFGNIVAGNTSVEGQQAPVGPLVRYRLKTTFTRALAEGARIKINIDTMDSGFGGGSSELSTKILDVEGTMRLNLGPDNPVDVKITSGPGPVVHTEEANANGDFVARSESGVVYVRPYNSMTFSSKMFGFDTGVGFIARKLTAFGEVKVSQVNFNVGFNFPGMFIVPAFKLNTNADYLAANPQSNPTGPSDAKLTFDTTFMMSQKLKSTFIYGTGKGSSPYNTMVGAQFDLMDMWDSGTYIVFKYKKVGEEYLYENAILDEDLFAGLDVFNRYVGNGNGLGIVDVGAELTQVLTESMRLVGRTDWRLAPDNAYDKEHAQCALILEGGLSWDIATDTLLETFYRVESVPSALDQSTDMVHMNLSFKF